MPLKYDISPIEKGVNDDWKGSNYTNPQPKALKYDIEPINQEPSSDFRLPFGGVAAADKQLQAVWNNLDFIPFAKYLRSEDRYAFSNMSGGQQAKALGWETFSLAMYGGVGALGRAGYKGVKALRKAHKIADVLEPLEDIGTWTTKHYGQTLGKFLKKDLKGMRTEEYNAIGRAMQGDNLGLRNALLGATSPKGQHIQATKKFKGLIQNVSGVPYGAYQLNPKAVRMLADYSPGAVMRRELFDNFTGQVKKMKPFGGKKYQTEHAEAVYKAQTRRFYGKDGPKKELWQATDEELFGFTQDLIKHPLSNKLVKNLLTPSTAMWIKPVRVVYGAAENTLGTLSGIYDPIKKASGMKNKYVGEMTRLFGLMGEQSGLFNVTKKGWRWKKGFTPQAIEETGRVMAEMERVGKALRKGEIGKAQADALIEASFGKIPAQVSRKHVTALSDTTARFFDQLYKQDFTWRLGKVFNDAGMTPAGRALFERQMKVNFGPRIKHLFDTKKNLGYAVKHSELTAILDEAKGFVAHSIKNPNVSWFTAKGEDALEVLGKSMNAQLSFGSKGVPHYLENYLPRLYGDAGRATSEIFQGIGGKQAAFYRKTRKAEEAGERLGLEELIFSRLQAQGKEMFVYPELKKVAAFTKTLPEEWKNLTSHYIARVLGMPSRGDELVARAIEPIYGRLEQIFGKTGVWDAHRAMRLSQNINDITYMGFLGLKPFSAMRNLFQPLINVPADLGGIRDLATLVKGYRVGLSKAGREELRSMGIITDYAPELKKNLKFFPTLHKKVVGVPTPTRSEVRDTMMWMFSNSDEMNRYVTGGAAMVKWGDAMKKAGLNKIDPGKFINLKPGTLRQIEGFMAKSGVNLRYPHVKAEIEMQLKAGRIAEARRIYIKDVVADTQYLYGKLDAPLVAQAWGGAGRTAVIFNSWWMNYGTAMQKWMTTGQVSEKNSRMFTWVLSNAIAMSAMKQMWSTQTAMKSTFLGPFPQPGQGMTPPSWEPMFKTMAMAGTMFNVLTLSEDPKKLEKQARSLGNTLFGFVPAGLQIKQFKRGYEKDEWKGVAKALIKFQPDED